MQVYDLKLAEITLFNALFVKVSRQKINSRTSKILFLAQNNFIRFTKTFVLVVLQISVHDLSDLQTLTTFSEPHVTQRKRHHAYTCPENNIS